VKGTWREGSPAADPDKYVEKALEMGISLHRGPALGNLEEGSSSGDFKMWAERGIWEWGTPLCGSSFREPGVGGSFFRAPEGYERKALGMGISPHGGSVGQPRVSSSTGDVEIWLKGALGVEHLFLHGSAVKGTWREDSPAGDPDKYVEKALETGISLHRGPVFGEHGGGLIYQGP
jgi:hypothetical protein